MPSATSLSLWDSFPFALLWQHALDTPRKDSQPGPKTFIIPRGGVQDISKIPTDTLAQPDSIRVMPGPGWNPDPSQNTYPSNPDTSSEARPFIPAIIHDPFRNSNALLLPVRGWEAKTYFQLYTQKAYYGRLGVAIQQPYRSSYFTGIFQATAGISRKMNLGLDLWFQSAHLDTSFGSPLLVFGLQNNGQSHAALTRIGPRIRFRLSPKKGILFQSSLLIPAAKDLDGSSSNRPGISSEQPVSWSQVYTNLHLGTRSILYLEANAYWNVSFKRNSGHIALPLTTYYSYFPVRSVAVQAMTQFWPYIGKGFVSAAWIQSGLGIRWAITSRFSLEAMGSRFWLGAYSAGPAQTFNVGMRYLKW